MAAFLFRDTHALLINLPQSLTRDHLTAIALLDQGEDQLLLVGTVDARLHGLLQDGRRPLGPEVLGELLHLPPLQVGPGVGLLVDVEADCGDRPASPQHSAHQPGSCSRVPLGPGLGKLKRGKSGSDSSYLVSKRGKEANCPNCQGLFPRGPPGWGQMDRWVPCDVLRSDSYGGPCGPRV